MADDKLPWMKFNPQEFMGDDRVGRMNAAQRGIYISLLCDAWQGEPGIPDDPDSLCFRCGATPDEMERAWPKVRPCFEEHPEKDGWLIHKRMEKERREALELRRKRAEAGRKGARAKWSKNGKANGGASGGDNGSASGKDSGGASDNRASGGVSSSSLNSALSDEGKESEEGERPAEWMHDLWHEALGSGRRIKLTAKRRQKYRAMYDEHLSEAKDPRQAWKVILWAVTQSDHHMSERSYQMPESLLRNEERRDTWIERTAATIESGSVPDADRKAHRRRKRMAEEMERRRAG